MMAPDSAAPAADPAAPMPAAAYKTAAPTAFRTSSGAAYAPPGASASPSAPIAQRPAVVIVAKVDKPRSPKSKGKG